MSELQLTQAQQIDPLMFAFPGGNPAEQPEHNVRSFGAVGRLGSRLMLATALILGVAETRDLSSEAKVAHADYRCSRFDPGAYRVDGLDENGLPTTYYMCPDNPPPTPTTSAGGSDGGGGDTGGDGNTGGGDTGGGGPSAPSWDDILTFYGCGEGLGDVSFSQQIDVLGGKSGIQRLEEMIAKCALTFKADATNASQNNWSELLALQEADITAPDANQGPVISAYMQSAWEAIHMPADTTTTTIAPVVETIPQADETVPQAEETIPQADETVPTVPPADAGSGGPKKPDTEESNNGLVVLGFLVAGALATLGLLKLRVVVLRNKLDRKTENHTKPKRGTGPGFTGGVPGNPGLSAGN